MCGRTELDGTQNTEALTPDDGEPWIRPEAQDRVGG